MAGKTRAAGNGKTSVKAKPRAKARSKAVSAVAVAEPEEAASAESPAENGLTVVMDVSAGPDQAVEPGITSEPEDMAGGDPETEPEQTVSTDTPEVRPDWAGHVCCSLAVRGYSKTGSGAPVGMSCEVHGPRYYVTADNVPLP